MNKIIHDPFTFHFPKIDIHGETSFSTPLIIDSFIKECLHQKKYSLIIIHGKGKGILKKATHDYLKKDPRIENYYLDNINDGQTIVELKK